MRAVRLWPRALFLIVALGAAAFSRGRAAVRRPGPPPPTADRLVMGSFVLQDAVFLAVGARRLAADAAWVQLLLYAAGGVAEEDAVGSWPELGPMTWRIVRLDPGFLRAYSFGASILAWYRNVNRPHEALELLREAQRNNPDHWPFAALAAAIGFKQRSLFHEMGDELAKVARHPGCPALVKSILANTYKAEGRYREALALWLDITESADGEPYLARAEGEIARLRSLIASRAVP